MHASADPSEQPLAILTDSIFSFLLVVVLMRALRVLLVNNERLVSQASAARAKLEYDATHDNLTGLANRPALWSRLDADLGKGVSAAVLFVDLDDFKTINDVFGHRHGDELLEEVGRRLREASRDGDLVARLGGDEFALVLAGVDEESAALRLAGRLSEQLRLPAMVYGRPHEVRASIGIAMLAPRDASQSVEEVLRKADAAMYAAKERGKGKVAVFQPSMLEEAEQRYLIGEELSAAVAEEQFLLLYQPLYDLGTLRPIGAEALLRWRHPRLGLLGPDYFLGLAHQSGIMPSLERWVLGEACSQAATWGGAASDARLGVNISPAQLADAETAEWVRDALARSGLQARRLVIEVTEAGLMADLDRAGPVLEQLVGMGVSVSLDDFGEGQSSLARLASLPLSSVKLHRSFLDSANPKLVDGVVRMAAAMGLRVVGQGVEEPRCLALLASLRCDMAQGHLLAPPSTSEVVGSLLARSERLSVMSGE